MKAISLWQPWATLIAIGAKRFETRSWSTNYRGPLAIHATKRSIPPLEVTYWMHEALAKAGWHFDADLPLGCVVCTVDLVNCYTTEDVQRQSWFEPFQRNEFYFGNYTPGRFAWRLDNLRLVDNVPAKGSQGFWEWTPPEGLQV